jgi:hypothetical protein
MTDDKQKSIGRLNAVKKALVARRPNHETRGGGRHERRIKQQLLAPGEIPRDKQLRPLPLGLRLAAEWLVVLGFACADPFSTRAVEPSLNNSRI